MSVSPPFYINLSGSLRSMKIPPAASAYNSPKKSRSTCGRHGCQIAIARFLDCMCLALWASGPWLRYATLQNLIPSFPWVGPPTLHPPPWRNPRKGRDQILPSGNLANDNFKCRYNLDGTWTLLPQTLKNPVVWPVIMIVDDSKFPTC